MSENQKKGASKRTRPEWFQTILQYQRPIWIKALWQLVNTSVLYALSWYLLAINLMGFQSILIHLGILFFAAGLQVRLFIIFHDCCHQSFFASKRANRVIGHIMGILTFTPYESWRRSHGIHHNTASNLDRRGKGDIWTLTVEEYKTAFFLSRVQYRLFRNPFILFILGPLYIFLIKYRFPGKGDQKRQINSLHITNAGIFAFFLLISFLIGWKVYLLIQLPIFLISGMFGVWLFYVQHQFEGVYWARQGLWDPLRAALEGSSFYQLPKVLQWFSGNIGFHHIHHIKPRIPNYNLPMCHDVMAPFENVATLKLRSSLKSLRLKLWDEQEKRLVGFSALKSSV